MNSKKAIAYFSDKNIGSPKKNSSTKHLCLVLGKIFCLSLKTRLLI